MDIYILRNDKQIGPFSDDATQTLLRQGTISADDLAWRPGLPHWRPLEEVLNTPTDLATGEAHSPPAIPKAEPASPQQIAFLSYFGIAVPTALSKERAEELITETFTNAINAPRLTLWKSERLRLHPELFAEEIQAKKTDRVQLYLDLCETAGVDYFTGVTKAHCQVLVAFLDVKFPRWDAHEGVATEDYFFPAIAEKFPQLVNKPWRGRLHYREGPASAAGGPRKAPTARLVHSTAAPLAAILRGIVLGLLILAVLYAIHRTT